MPLPLAPPRTAVQSAQLLINCSKILSRLVLGNVKHIQPALPTQTVVTCATPDAYASCCIKYQILSQFISMGRVGSV